MKGGGAVIEKEGQIKGLIVQRRVSGERMRAGEGGKLKTKREMEGRFHRTISSVSYCR